jgi:pimeloyl-ACP methyl ester carboxylesterase
MIVASLAVPAHGASKPPSLLLAFTEFPRAFIEVGTLPWLSPLLLQAPKGDGHPVLLLPGFMAGEGTMKPLFGYLKKLGYDPYQWELGRNLGPRAVGLDGEKMVDRLEAIYEQTGRKISIIGWSLGGAFARQLSRRRPDLVRQVISLGSPLTGTPRSTNAWRAYEWLTGQKMSDPKLQEQVREGQEPPPVPSTAIFSKNDGIVAWQTAREPQAATTDNIEVRGSHCGLGANPAVWWAIADRLALPENGWKPFERSGARALIYPSSGH